MSRGSSFSGTPMRPGALSSATAGRTRNSSSIPAAVMVIPGAPPSAHAGAADQAAGQQAVDQRVHALGGHQDGPREARLREIVAILKTGQDAELGGRQAEPGEELAESAGHDVGGLDQLPQRQLGWLHPTAHRDLLLRRRAAPAIPAATGSATVATGRASGWADAVIQRTGWSDSRTALAA